MAWTGETTPTYGFLCQWRDDMLNGSICKPNGEKYSINTINARLSAIRKLLRRAALDTPDMQLKTMLRDWASIENAKSPIMQDKLDEDYGRRLSLDSLTNLILSMPDNLKGMRDKAIVSLGAGAGLRVAEIANVTVKDVFESQNALGQKGIRVRDSKHGKTRVVVVDQHSWVLRNCWYYLGVSNLHPKVNDRLIRGVKYLKEGHYKTVGKSISTRQIQAIFEGEGGYKAEYQGSMVQINMHDLRRTYAKLCHDAGMPWEALRQNLGHSSIRTTELYVGTDEDWSNRVPEWSIK